MLRIGMILDKSFPPDPRVENEARLLINAGNQVYLFCLDYDGITEEEEVDGIQVRRYGSSLFEYKMSALAHTVPIYAFSLRNKIRRFLSDNAIQVIHLHDMIAAQAIAWANRGLNLPLILDLHENRPEIMSLYPHLQRFPGKYLVSIDRWRKKELEYVQLAQHTLVVTDEARETLSESPKVDPDKIVVMPNTVRRSFYSSYSEERSITDRYRDRFVLLYLGDTGLRRGLLTAIDALPELVQHIPQIKLVIVGSNSSDPVLFKRAEELGLKDHLEFAGWQKEELFPSYLKVADLGISPLHANKHHETTLANKLFQYMSFSVPILASNVGAQKNLIERAGSGLVHEAQNVPDFVDKCLRLFRAPEIRKEMGSKGRDFVENEFSLEKVGIPMISMYESLERELTET